MAASWLHQLTAETERSSSRQDAKRAVLHAQTCRVRHEPWETLAPALRYGKSLGMVRNANISAERLCATTASSVATDGPPMPTLCCNHAADGSSPRPRPARSLWPMLRDMVPWTVAWLWGEGCYKTCDAGWAWAMHRRGNLTSSTVTTSGWRVPTRLTGFRLFSSTASATDSKPFMTQLPAWRRTKRLPRLSVTSSELHGFTAPHAVSSPIAIHPSPSIILAIADPSIAPKARGPLVASVSRLAWRRAAPSQFSSPSKQKSS